MSPLRHRVGSCQIERQGAKLSRMETRPKLTPLLVVRDAARAITFYVRGLGAKEIARYLHPTKKTISHADLAVSDVAFSVTEEARERNSDAPPSLGGSPVVLQPRVADVDAVFKGMCLAGAVVVFSLQEFVGERMCRVRDPFGHLWILSQRIQDLSAEEIRKRRDARKPAKQRMRPHPPQAIGVSFAPPASASEDT